MKSISVVIPNFNGLRLFKTYFRHNFELLKSIPNEVEIIVVDDASQDESVAYLRKEYGNEIIIIEKKENSGFSETCNIGIRHATMDLVFLLNTDVIIEDGYFEKQLHYFNKPDTFGVMGRIVGMNDEGILDAARSPKISGRKIKPSHFYYLSDQTTTPTFYLSGAIALMDTAKLKAMKGFNEMFNPYYGEDQELSIRAWRLGWKCYYEHHAICRHEESATTKGHKSKNAIKRIHFRNRYYIHHLHLQGWDLGLYHLQIIMSDVIFGSLCLQWFKPAAYFDFIRNRKELGKKKSDFKRQMKRHQSTIQIMDIIKNIRLTQNFKSAITWSR